MRSTGAAGTRRRGMDAPGCLAGGTPPLAEIRRETPTVSRVAGSSLPDLSVRIGFQARGLDTRHGGAFEGLSEKFRCVEPDAVVFRFRSIHWLRAPDCDRAVAAVTEIQV